MSSVNCIVCAKEFNDDELENVTLSEINSTNFKVCFSCFNCCDPAEDYREVRDVVNSYLKFAETRLLYDEVILILSDKKDS